MPEDAFPLTQKLTISPGIKAESCAPVREFQLSLYALTAIHEGAKGVTVGEAVAVGDAVAVGEAVGDAVGEEVGEDVGDAVGVGVPPLHSGGLT